MFNLCLIYYVQLNYLIYVNNLYIFYLYIFLYLYFYILFCIFIQHFHKYISQFVVAVCLFLYCLGGFTASWHYPEWHYFLQVFVCKGIVIPIKIALTEAFKIKYQFKKNKFTFAS